MQVTARCDPLSGEDVSKLLATSSIHIGPVLNEIPLALAMRLVEGDSIASIDPQGYLRQLAHSGTVLLRKWRYPSLLKKIEVLKTCEEELGAIIGHGHLLRKLSKLGPEIALVRRGVKGTVVWSKNEGTFNVPAYKTSVRDPTGAGGALVGAFLASWVRTGDLLWSIAVGSALASFVVAKVGPGDFGTPKQIERRVQRVLHGTVRMRG